ncbi:uncharacterized protein [Triticum aestivum]|uniref:uncharacterized protein isoform X2 n=1 Tax=Triticum aestivum TaxID=4565 RepID=UPI001D027BA8|nr:uncharacterized protein LOC123040436 isoform X2 [Triticum aestivum]
MEDAALEFLMDPINRFPFREEFAATLSIQIRLVLLPCCDAHPAMPADSNGRSGCAQDEGPQANYDEERMLLQIGYFPLYALASYMVYTTRSGVPTAVQGGVYAVGAGGYGGFYPTWVAA